MTTYLDNAATSFPKPEAVYQAMDRFARSSLANPGRAGHKMALAAEHALDDGRHRLNRSLRLNATQCPMYFAYRVRALSVSSVPLMIARPSGNTVNS